MRTKIIRLVTFLAGIYFFLEFVLPKVLLDKLSVSTYHEAISDGFVLVGAMAFGLGLINLCLVHGSKIAFVRKGWFNSIALLLGLIITTIIICFDWAAQQEIQSKVASISNTADFARHIQEGVESKQAGLPDVDFRISKLLESFDIAERDARLDLESFSTKLESDLAEDEVALALYKQQKADLERIFLQLSDSKKQLNQPKIVWDEQYQANLDTFTSQVGELAANYGQLLRQAAEASFVSHLWQFIFNGLFVALGSAMFSLLGVYIASAAYRAFRVRSLESSLMMITAVIVMLGQIPFGLWIYEDLPHIRLWLMEYPSSAAFRAIKIGAAVAGLVMALRMWFSIESDYSNKAVE